MVIILSSADFNFFSFFYTMTDTALDIRGSLSVKALYRFYDL